MLLASRLSRVARGGTVLLDEVDLELAPGERLALAGPSGAGKSVLLRALVLLDPLDGGTVTWEGSAPSGEEIPRFRRRVHYLQQKPLIGEDRVAAQLALPWTLRSARDQAFDRERAAALLDRAGRPASFLERTGTDLSGGEAQLVALARALLLDSAVLLLDEPTAAMDGVTKAAAEGLLEDWIDSDPRRAWIWVSHDESQLTRTCERRVRIESGKVSA